LALENCDSILEGLDVGAVVGSDRFGTMSRISGLTLIPASEGAQDAIGDGCGSSFSITFDSWVEYAGVDITGSVSCVDGSVS